MARISTSTAKDGDTLNIGKRTPTFVQTPMVHWLDNMVLIPTTTRFSSPTMRLVSIMLQALVLKTRQTIARL